MIKAIIFDLDGVLVDAVQWHFFALNKSLQLFGYEISTDENISTYNGLPTRTKLNLLSGKIGLPSSLHPFINEMKQHYTKEILNEYCHPELRVTRMLKALKSKGFQLGLASNSNRATVDRVLERMGIKRDFDVVLSRDEVNESKPSPEIYEKCFSRLRVTPEESLIIEDSIPGIEAADQTGAFVLEVKSVHEVNLERVLSEIARFQGITKFKESSVSKTRKSTPEVEIIIPMAGLGQRFADAGFQKPKPLIDVMNRPMIEWVVDNIRPTRYRAHFTFICNESHLQDLNVRPLLKKIAPNCTIVSTKGLTQGAACTVLLATEQLQTTRPLLIANSDQFVNTSIDSFLDSAFESDCDGLIMTFKAKDKKWSFAKLDSNGKVIEVAEKKPISDQATVGIYYFKHASDFLTGAQEMIRKNIRTNGEFYVCPVYNELISAGKNIQISEIPPQAMHGLGTPEDLNIFLREQAA